MNNEEYEQELYHAFRLWAGPKYGNLVFTSSTAVYGDSFGNTVDEKFRTDVRTLRASRAVSAEHAILARGGSVVRLAGLYSKNRGPHTYWLRAGEVKGDSEGKINLLHYEDAAGVVIAALKSPLRRQVYLASDDQPVSRQEICEAALMSGEFPEANMPIFVAQNAGRGKRTDSSWTRGVLQWTPKHVSFPAYMYGLAGLTYEPEKKLDSGSLLLGGFEDDDIDFDIQL